MEASLDPKLKYSWQHAVLDAFIEFNPERIHDKFRTAQKAVSARLLENPTDSDEVIALQDALAALRTLFRASQRGG